MKPATKERFEIIEFIIKTIGDKGREIKTDYLSELVDKVFPNKFKNETESYIYFKSQINLLSNEYSIIKESKNFVGLTPKGIEVYEMENGFYEYLEQKDNAIKMERFSFKMNIANSIATILATCIAAGTLWLTYGTTQMKASLIILGISCFILGFTLRGVIMSMLKKTWNNK